MTGVMQWLVLVVLVGASVATAQTDRTQTIINGKPLTAQQKAEFVRIYGTPPLGGNFWYDPRSGLWGVTGREAFGLLRPGHEYGPLAPTASAGNTGVFINGRQINLAEALYIRNLFGSVVPGRWWLDGTTGYFGVEGSQIPLGNLFATARAAQARSGGASYYNDGMGTSVAVSAGCATGTAGSGSSQTSFIIGCD